MIIALVIFFVALVTKLVIDYNLWLKGTPNNHKLGPALVLIALVGCSWLAGWHSTPMWFLGWTCLFDPAFAIMIGQKWYYVGETATLDKIQRKRPILQTLKYVLFIGSVIFFIYA